MMERAARRSFSMAQSFDASCETLVFLEGSGFVHVGFFWASGFGLSLGFVCFEDPTRVYRAFVWRVVGLEADSFGLLMPP